MARRKCDTVVIVCADDNGISWGTEPSIEAMTYGIHAGRVHRVCSPLEVKLEFVRDLRGTFVKQSRAERRFVVAGFLRTNNAQPRHTWNRNSTHNAIL